MTSKSSAPVLAIELPSTVEACHAVIAELLVRVAELEERAKLNSKNSSKPPSSDGPGRTPRSDRPKSARKRAAQPGREGKFRALHEAKEVDHFVECAAPETCRCGAAMHAHGAPVRHQVFDIPPIKPVVTEYRRHASRCRQCGRHARAPLPAGVPRGQLGVNALALVGSLSAQFHLSQHKIKTLFEQVFGLTFSIGAISQAQGKVAQVLEPVCAELHAAIKQEAVVHADETSHRNHGHLLWSWAAVCAWGGHFKIQASRGKLAAQNLLGERIAGHLVSDRYAGYAWVDAQKHQVCWAHLRRDFARIAQRPGLAGRLGGELSEMGGELFGLRRDRAERARWDQFQSRMKTTLSRASTQTECTKTANTCANLLKIWPSLWHFVDHDHVPPTNNLAERALRGLVIYRKVSYGTRSGRGMRFVERAFATAYTCRQQGRNFFAFLGEAFRANLSDHPAPSLVPG